MQPYYDDGQGIVIYHGDCRDVLPTLPAVDLVLTDPPYGTTACKWDTIIPFESMWREVKRSIKPRGAIVLFGSQPFTSALVMSNPAWFKYAWVWHKHMCTGFPAARYRPLLAHEDILVFGDGAIVYHPQMVQRSDTELKRLARVSKVSTARTDHASHLALSNSNRDDNRLKHPGTLLDIPGVLGSSGAKVAHPTQKPVALMAYLVQTYSDPGATVLDFTMGSGTTLRAAKDLGRKAIGIEIEERYCEIAALRLQQEVLAV